MYGRGIMRVERLLDISCGSPDLDLATEEAILDAVETGQSPGTLRFWESPCTFVVAGVGQVLREVVNLDACQADGVPVQRRCSAGGCVLQGPGCLNYALFLSYAQHPEVAQLRPSYAYLLGLLCRAFQAEGIALAPAGISDIAVAGVKVSGHAQKRRRRALLHHGTLLYGMSWEWMARYLPEPRDRPAYRAARRHGEFVANLPLDAAALRGIVRTAFGAPETPSVMTAHEDGLATALAEGKYRDPEWIYRR